jgi:8-oxo-dGTP diphosphatase
MTRLVQVAAVALVDDVGRVLMAQRPAGKSFAGQWEFPGGKIESGETPEAALVRELAEELGIDVATAALEPLTFVSHAYPDFHLLMLFYACRAWTGMPHGIEGQALVWDTVAALAHLPMPPADIPLLAALRQALDTPCVAAT